MTTTNGNSDRPAFAISAFCFLLSNFSFSFGSSSWQKPQAGLKKIKSKGYWAAFGTCATYGGSHAMAGNPTGAMGLPDYLGWRWKSKAGIPIVCVPGCPIQPDNLSETILYLLYQATGQAPMIPLD